MVKISQKIKNKEKEINLYKNKIKNPFNVSNEVFKLEISRKQIEIKILSKQKIAISSKIFFILMIILEIFIIIFVSVILIVGTLENVQVFWAYKISIIIVFVFLMIMGLNFYSCYKREMKNIQNLEIKKDQISKNISYLYCDIKKQNFKKF